MRNSVALKILRFIPVLMFSFLLVAAAGSTVSVSAAECKLKKKKARKVRVFINNTSALRLEVSMQNKRKRRRKSRNTKIDLLGTVEAFTKTSFVYRPSRRGGRHRILFSALDAEGVAYDLLEPFSKGAKIRPLSKRCTRRHVRVRRTISRLPYSKNTTGVNSLCAMIPGPWAWHNGVTVVNDNGTAVNEGIVTYQNPGEPSITEEQTLLGEWTCDEATGQVSFIWNDGEYRDDFSLVIESPEKIRLSGFNLGGFEVNAQKL